MTAGPQGTPGPTPSSGGALRAALAAEHAAVYGYGVVGAHADNSQREVAEQAWIEHRERRDRLRALMSRRGLDPEPAAVAYRLPFAVDGPAAAARLAARLEEGAVEAYIGLVADSDPALREFAAVALQEYAARAARWRGTAPAFPGMPRRAIYGTRPAGSRSPGT